MGLDRKRFFDQVRKAPFAGRLSRGQVAGMEAILAGWEKRQRTDGRFLAYMLATVFHETAAAMQPVRETRAKSDAAAIAILERAFSAGRLAHVRTPYWRFDGEGKSWLGRGLVQITHKDNYRRLGEATGIDLLADPGRALEMEVALPVLFDGMERGLFTGQALKDHFGEGKTDWLNARRIINGTESAAKVAALGRAFHAAVRAANTCPIPDG